MLRITLAAALLLAAGTTTPVPTPTTQNTVTTAGGEQHAESVFEFYAKNMRQSLFSGFLTLGSFLVAVNTFIVVQLKKELYDRPRYQETVKENRRKNPKTSFYGPLKRLSGMLIWVIGLAIATAVMQLTVGIFLANLAGAVICLSIAAVTIVILGFVLWTIKGNLRTMFDHCEAEAMEQEAKENV